jgi:spermidine/putrescine transport system permease protein
MTAARDTRSMLGRRGTLKFLAGPPFAWLALFFVLPLVLIAAFSLRAGSGAVGPSEPWAPTGEQYAEVLGTPAFMRLLGVSVLMALGIAGLATLFAYPIAYFLTFRAGARAPLFLTLLLIPFAVSYLLRVMAWKLMLGPQGGINSLLSTLGLTDEPLGLLLYSRPAVIITLVYVWIPFAALPVYAAMQRIDRNHLEAAADLGAGPWSRFWRVTVPLSLPGALATFFMVFIPTVGEYVTPALVGGTDGIMYGNIIQGFFTRSANWPMGSAMAMIMLVMTLTLVVIGLRIVNPRRLLT